jgi:hypothetical protein
MSFRQTFSKVKKDIKGRFKGLRRNRDKRGPGTSGEGTDLEESRSRSESPFVGGGDRDLEGSGSNPAGEPIVSTDRPAQQDESDPVSLGEITLDAAEGRGDVDVDQSEGGQPHPLRPHSDVEAVVGSGHSGKVEPAPSDPSIPENAEPTGMLTSLFSPRFLTLPSNNIDPTPVPDHSPEGLHPEVSAEPGTVADEKKTDWKSTVSATAKLLLRGVRDTADAFGPLKSVAGGLCFLLENYEVFPVSCIPYVQRLQASQQTKTNGQAMESLAPRVKALAEQICGPILEGDTKEEKRRGKLEK